MYHRFALNARAWSHVEFKFSEYSIIFGTQSVGVVFDLAYTFTGESGGQVDLAFRAAGLQLL
jgi:hypothetical protein